MEDGILRGFFLLLGSSKKLQADLVNLSFIEFARWVIIPRNSFPLLGHGQKREALKV